MVDFVFTGGARGCSKLMEKGMSKCRRARVSFGRRVAESPNGRFSVTLRADTYQEKPSMPEGVRVGARQKAVCQD